MPNSELALQILAAYGIAINLAYLNLPNLRFPARIKDAIRNVKNIYEPKVYPQLSKNDPRYKTIYALGSLNELHGLPLQNLPTPSENVFAHLDSVPVHVFMYIWCTQVRVKNCSQPIDKLISAVFLCVCSIYVYYLAGMLVAPAYIYALGVIFWFFFSFAIIVSAIYLWQKDYITGLFTLVSSVYIAISIFAPSLWFGLDIANQGQMLLVLALTVIVPTVFVVFSYIMYPIIERQYKEYAVAVFEEAKTKTLSNDPKPTGAGR